MSDKRPPAVIRFLHAVENTALVAVLSIMIVLSFGQILMRNFFGVSYAWLDPLLRFLVLWVAMLGAMVATREDHHISIDVLSFLVTGRGKAILRIVTDLFTATVAVLLTHASVRFITDEFAGGAKAFGGVPTWVAELILPIAFGVIALRFGYFFLRHSWQAIRGVTEPAEAVEDDAAAKKDEA
ncbi:MAG: TRAP transporter small permease [Candidatus Lernaella stagnicola]|nr:TRAP transporter small permease [Candidatus Lernaella stagnicola]